jgi:hypothetical protein
LGTWRPCRQQQTAEFAFKLREFGIDVDVDLFHAHDPSVNWTTYGPRAIKEREFVFILASPEYRERWEGTAAAGTGAGAAREANVLKALFNQDQDAFLRKVKIIMLPGATTEDIPLELQAVAQRFEIQAIDEDGLEDLIRTVSRQPAYVVPPLGALPFLPPVRGGERVPAQKNPLKDKIADTIMALPEAEKLVIALRYFENLTREEVARLLDLPPERVLAYEQGALASLGVTAAALADQAGGPRRTL